MKIVALFLFLGQVNVVLAQELSGTYKSNQNYLEFQNDSVCLRYKSPSGSFQQALYACGKCKWVEDFLIVQCGAYYDQNFRLATSSSNEESEQQSINLTGEFGFEKNPATITLIDSHGNSIQTLTTDKFGNVKLNRSERTKTLKIECFGYLPVITEYNSKLDYQITLTDGEAMGHRNLVFYISNRTETSVDLRLTTTIFDSKENESKQLQNIMENLVQYDFETLSFAK